MNYRETKEANRLINRIEKLDNFTIDVQNPARTLTVSSQFDGVTINKEYKAKIIQVILEMRRELAEELEKLGVTEYDDND
nr:MAG TPA: hypothetical protein [Caudoviricetes sp.]